MDKNGTISNLNQRKLMFRVEFVKRKLMFRVEYVMRVREERIERVEGEVVANSNA